MEKPLEERSFTVKDRIKYFQKEMKNIPYFEKSDIKPKKTFPKEKETNFDEKNNNLTIKPMYTLNLIINSGHKALGEEIKHFLREKPVFPCLLISKEDNGKIEMNMNCLKDIDINSIKIIKEDSFEMTKRKDMKDNQMIDFSNYQFDISVIHNNLNFSKKTKNIQKGSEKNNMIIGKYKLYSFNINEGDLSFQKYFIDKFENIANDVCSDNTKAKEIDEIFESQGYYIPLKIYIGGLFINRYNKVSIRGIRDSMRNFNMKVGFEKYEIENCNKIDISTGKDINKIFINENTQIIGGDKTEKDFDKWTKSVKVFNSNIIECTNIIEAKNILPNELKKKLKIPLQLVERKYSARKKYFQYISSIKDIVIEDNLKGYNDLSKGICKESEIPEIYVKTIRLFGAKSFPYTTKTISESFNDIIIGFKIRSERDDDYNGEWTIKFNPLLKKEINIDFVSQLVRDEKYMIFIYLIKFPE